MTKINLKYISIYIILIGFVGSVTTSLVLPIENIFIVDYYSKRALIISSIPLLGLLIAFPNKFGITRNKLMLALTLLLYLFFLVAVNINQSTRPVNYNYIVTELIQFSLLPLFLLIVNSKIELGKVYKLLLTLSLITMIVISFFDIKVQYSYIGIPAFLFLYKHFSKNLSLILRLLLYPLMTVMLIKSMLGKSSILILALSIIIYLYLYGYKAKYILALVLFSMILGLNTDRIKQTGAYRNTIYFARNLDLDNNSFDNSTLNRIYEAQIVNKTLGNSLTYNMMGLGLGGSIDMSLTPDKTVINAQNNPSETRNIHLLYYYLKLKSGYIGVLLYYLLFIYVIYCTYKVLKYYKINPNKKYVGAIYFLSSYIVIILWDGQISASHLFSNYLFWFSSIFVVLTHNQIKSNKPLL